MTLPSSIYTNKGATALITPPAIPLHPTDVEWVRKDIAQAMVAAAYLDAANLDQSLWRETSAYKSNQILKRTPADARAALDAMLAKAREDALREAANRNAITVRSIKEAIDFRDYDAAREIAIKGNAALLALIDQTAEGEA